MNARCRAGFTLVEVLVGLVVASLTLLAGVAALGFVTDRADAVEALALEQATGASQRALLVDWLVNARPVAPTGERFEGFIQEEDGEQVSLLLFPTTAPTPTGSSTSVVGLYVDHDPETPEQGLVAEMTGARLGEEPRRMELVGNVVRMQIRYLPWAESAGQVPDAMAESDSPWTDQWQGRNTLPRAVEITLEAAPGDSLPRLLRYPIRAAMPRMTPTGAAIP